MLHAKCGFIGAVLSSSEKCESEVRRYFLITSTIVQVPQREPRTTRRKKMLLVVVIIGCYCYLRNFN
jgi:hypothetical protein